MLGKVLKVASNDLYGNVDDRVARVYACFKHNKYMNNYVIFSIEGDLNKLCFGSIHFKNDSIVIFSVNEKTKKHIVQFVDEYINDKLKDFTLLEIGNVSKVELVSHCEMEFDKLALIDNKSIPKVVVSSDIEEKQSKPVILYLFLFVLVLSALGITLLYLKPELFTVKYKGLECYDYLVDMNLNLSYKIDKNIIFDLDDKVESIDVVRTYSFVDSITYYEFKDKEESLGQYFNNGEGYKFIDEALKFKVFSEEDSVIDDYDEMLTYLKREGFSCVEKVYEK